MFRFFKKHSKGNNRGLVIFLTIIVLFVSVSAFFLSADIVQGGEVAAEEIALQEADETAEVEAKSQLQKLKTSVKSTDNKKKYTVTVSYDAAAGLPEDTELSVAEINQTPADLQAAKKQGRPSDTENFVSKKALKTMKSELAASLDVAENETVFFTKFLKINLINNEKSVTPLVPVEVTIETDAVQVNPSDGTDDYFLVARYDKQADRNRNETLYLDQGAENVSDVLGENESKTPAEQNATRVRFLTDQFGRFGLMGVEEEAEQTVQLTEEDRDVTILQSDKPGTTTSIPENQNSHNISLSGTLPATPGETVTITIQDESTQAYTVTWVNEDGTVLETDENVASGATPSYDGATPVKEADAQYTYTFKGWNPEINPVTNNVTYTAVYDRTVNEYTVTWVDDDGKPISSARITYGNTPANTTPPAKVADVQYTYTFAGWEPEVTPVTGDVTYTAVYTKELNTYTITWKMDNGEVLKSEVLPYGTQPTYSDVPYKPSTATATYSFIGWSPEVKEVTGDADYTAVFKEAVIELFLREQGSADENPIKGAEFTLENSEHIGTILWKGSTDGTGKLYIKRVAEEKENGEGAVFAAGSRYILRQTKTGEDFLLPLGYWVISVQEDGSFSMSSKHDSSDYSTSSPEGPYGIRFYLDNSKKASITFDYNYPEGVDGQPANVTEKLNSLSYDGEYKIKLEKPSLSDYEFVGWIDDNNDAWAADATLALNTINIKEHTLRAGWRAPLQVEAATYRDGDWAHAEAVKDSEMVFAPEETGMSYVDMSSFCAVYGNKNAAVASVNKDASYSFAFAAIAPDKGEAFRITSLRYSSSEHVWQYRRADASAVWVNLALGDQLTMYYTSNTVKVYWVKDTNGTFSALDNSALPEKEIHLSGDAWFGAEDLFGAFDIEQPDSIIEGDCYFHYFGLGAQGITKDSDLFKGSADDLQAFYLKHSEEGVYYNTASAGAGTLTPGISAVYLVYSEQPLEHSAVLEIENYTDYDYNIKSIFAGNAAANNLLTQKKAVLKAADGLKIFDGGSGSKHAATTVPKNSTVQLILQNAAEQTFVVDGGFDEAALEQENLKISAAVASEKENTVTRTLFQKDRQDDGETVNDFLTTKKVSRGVLDPEDGKTTLSFDSELTSFTIRKTWSTDAYPDNMSVQFAVFEAADCQGIPEGVTYKSRNDAEGLQASLEAQNYSVRKCISPDSRIVTAADDWTLTIENLPARHQYYAEEQKITRKTTDETELFTPVYNLDGRVLTVQNNRSNEVCRVGREEFVSIKDAVAYLVSNNITDAKIEMLCNYTVDANSAVTIPEGYSVELTTAADVEGLDWAVITRGFQGDPLFDVKGKLLLTNVCLDAKRNDTYYSASGNGGLVTVAANAEFTAGEKAILQNGRAEGKGGAVYGAENSKIMLEKDAKITGCQAAAGSAVYIENKGTLTFTGGNVTSNRTTGNAGGAIGLGGSGARVFLSGNVVIRDNRKSDGVLSNLYLDQPDNQVIQVQKEGLGETAEVGIYVPDGADLRDAHGRPAKPFATWNEDAENQDKDYHLKGLVNDRFNSNSPARYGYKSEVLNNTVVWGETVDFTVHAAWMDADYKTTPAPEGAKVTAALKFTDNGNITENPGTITLSADSAQYTFRGLAKYNESGGLCGYWVGQQSVEPSDYKPIIFTGDIGTGKDLPAKYRPASDTVPEAVLYNHYRYTTFTVTKIAKNLPEGQSLKSSFALYGIPKQKGVSGAHDLPFGLRDEATPSAWADVQALADDASITLSPTGRFFQVEGGNRWYCQLSAQTVTGQQMKKGIAANLSAGTLVTFHAYYSFSRGDFTVSGGSFTLPSGNWEAGDVICYEGSYYVLKNGTGASVTGVSDENVWKKLDFDGSKPEISIQFTRQDGDEGVLSVGGQFENTINTNQTCQIEAGHSHTFEKLESDYYYYAVETSAQEIGGKGRSLPGIAKLVAVYDPAYEYDQAAGKETVTNTYRDGLATYKEWMSGVTPERCEYEVYKVEQNLNVSQTDILQKVVKAAYAVKNPTYKLVPQQELSFSLPEENGSFVHVIPQEQLDKDAVYFVKEVSSGGVAIQGADIFGKEEALGVDAVYKYEADVNLYTVKNLSAILCKVVDPDGTEHVFRKIRSAYEYGKSNEAFHGEFKIEMLRNYAIPSDDYLTIDSGMKVALTTAADGFTTGSYKYSGAGTKAVLSRGSGNTFAFFKVNGEESDLTSTSLTLKNINLEGNETQVSYRINNTTYYDGGFIYATNAAVKITTENGSMDTGVVMTGGKANNGGAVYAKDGSVEVDHASFYQCSSTDTNGAANRGGGAIWASGKTLVITDSVFSDCTAKQDGGAVNDYYLKDGKTEIYGCTFADCSSGRYGGAVCSRNQTLIVAGSKTNDVTAFSVCSAANWGGGVCHYPTLLKESCSQVSNCRFTDCRQTVGQDGTNDGGGAINSKAETLRVQDSFFTGCTAHSRGGGIQHYNNANKTATEATIITACSFENCVAETSGGGGMCVAGLKLTVTGCTFDSCKSLASAGGGIDYAHHDVDKNAEIAECTFTRCETGTSGYGGGGISSGGSTMKVTKCKFTECKANNTNNDKYGGGGIAMCVGGKMDLLEVYGCTFKDCSSTRSGGSICTLSTKLIIDDYSAAGTEEAFPTTFENSTAEYYGGGVYQSVNDTYLEESSVAIQNAAFQHCYTNKNRGGALYTTAKAVLAGSGKKPVQFTECSAVYGGGAIGHERGTAGSSVLLENCLFKQCTVTHNDSNYGGGALLTRSERLHIVSSQFTDCVSDTNGGAISHNLNNNNIVAASSANVEDSAFVSCKTNSGSGGALYTTALKLTVSGKNGTETFRDCSAAYFGGAVYHNRSCSPDKQIQASTRLENCSFKNCEVNGNNNDRQGGGIRTNATTLELEKDIFTDCKAGNNGGAVYHRMGDENTQLSASYTTVKKCVFDTCKTTNGGGGAIHSNALNLNLYGEAGKDTFITCSSGARGGAVYHERSNDNATTRVIESSFTDCTATHASNNTYGGAIASSAGQLIVESSNFVKCTAKNDGGGIYHDRAAVNTSVSLTKCLFEDCSAVNGSGGGIRTRATAVSLENDVFSDCQAKGTGGGFWHELGNNDQIPVSSVIANGCRFTSCKASTGNAGALYTMALELSIYGRDGEDTFTGCSAGQQGGAVYHNRSMSGGKHAATYLQDCSFVECASTSSGNNNGGGGLKTWATTLKLMRVNFANCSALDQGGAVYHVLGNNDQIPVSYTFIEDCNFMNCSAAKGDGGAVKSSALTLTAKGQRDVNVFENCCGGSWGGAICHDRDYEGSLTTIKGYRFENCSVNYENKDCHGGALATKARTAELADLDMLSCMARTNGGAIYLYSTQMNMDNSLIDGCTDSSKTVTNAINGGGIYSWKTELNITGSIIRNCTVKERGGAIYQKNTNSKSVTLDNCQIEDNTAGAYGGGVYFYSQNSLTLKNGTAVTGNRLTSATVSNGAGIYLEQVAFNPNLIIGGDLETDTITVYDNAVSSDEQSNIRLHTERVNNKDQNRKLGISLLSNLARSADDSAGLIGVCNPGPENTQFGIGNAANRTGVDCFVSDDGLMYGVISPTDAKHLDIIWFRPPVCKITDDMGTALNYGDGEGQPAVFTSLIDAFKVLNTVAADTFKDQKGNVVEPKQIQMLVASYTLEGTLPELSKSVTMTTAAYGTEPYQRQIGNASTRCVIIRGMKVTGSMINIKAGVTLTIMNLALDGAGTNAKPQTSNSNGGLINAAASSGVILQNKAVLQNSKTSLNGGAVYLGGGATLTMNRDSQIRNCSAANGGGVYVYNGAVLTMEDNASINDCAASTAGGAVYVAGTGTMTIKGTGSNVISGNTVTGDAGRGAGIYLHTDNSCLNLQGNLEFENNTAAAFEKKQANGGDVYDAPRQDVYLGSNTNPAHSIAITDNINAKAGSIWVWANSDNHYMLHDQFAQVAENARIADSSLKVFRNAREDGLTENRTEQYYTGFSGSVLKKDAKYVYWGVDIVNVTFLKADAYGNGLAGAKFAVYTDEALQNPLKDKRGNAVTAFSETETDARPQGIVEIRNVLQHSHTYYLRETDVPTEDYEGFAATYKENDDLYRVKTGADDSFVMEVQKKGKWTALKTKDAGHGEAFYLVTNIPDIGPLTIVVRDKNGPEFTLPNTTLTLTNENGTVVWSGTSKEDGILTVPWVEKEEKNGAGASFYRGRTYTLKETAAEQDYELPQGSWTLSVDDQYQFVFATNATEKQKGNTFDVVKAENKNTTFDLYNVGSRVDFTVKKTWKNQAGEELAPDDPLVKGETVYFELWKVKKPTAPVSGGLPGGLVMTTSPWPAWETIQSNNGNTVIPKTEKFFYYDSSDDQYDGYYFIFNDISENDTQFDQVKGPHSDKFFNGYNNTVRWSGRILTQDDLKFRNQGYWLDNVKAGDLLYYNGAYYLYTLDYNQARLTDANVQQDLPTTVHTLTNDGRRIPLGEGDGGTGSSISLDYTNQEEALGLKDQLQQEYSGIEVAQSSNILADLDGLYSLQYDSGKGDWSRTIYGLDARYLYYAIEVRVGSDTDMEAYSPTYKYETDHVTITNLASSGSRRVILRKVSDSYASLSGAQFEIFKSDKRTNVSVTGNDGTVTTTFTSSASGVFFVGELSYGTYYVKETQAPDGYTTPGENEHFVVTVSEDGVGYQSTEDGQTNYSNSVRLGTSDR